jgi:hypothetical protein
VPRKLGMSSGSAETTMAAFAVQYALGMRIMNREQRRDSGRPTVVHTDNLATLQGTAMENVPVLQRYLSARRALVRQAQQDGAVEIRSRGVRPTNDQAHAPSASRGRRSSAGRARAASRRS